MLQSVAVRKAMLCFVCFTCMCRMLLGQSSRTDALALEAAGQNAQAEQVWREISVREPANAEAVAHIGLMESRQEHYAEAIEFYQMALKLDPKVPGLELNLGLAYFKSAQFRLAIKPFTAELRQHPGDERLTILLGMSHYGMGDYLVAIPFLKQGAEKQPSSLPLRLALAHSCLWSKQYDCVLATYKEILILDPASAEAEMLAGEALDETGDDAGALTHFKAAEASNPKEPNVHFGIGYLLWTQNHYAEAAAEFQHELDVDPQHAEAAAYLGDSEVQLNNYGAAEAELKKGLEGNPSSSMVHRDLGIVYTATGRNAEATDELQRAVELDPKDPSAHWRLAKLYQAMGKKSEAAAEFAKVSTMNAAENRTLPSAMTAPPQTMHP